MTADLKSFVMSVFDRNHESYPYCSELFLMSYYKIDDMPLSHKEHIIALLSAHQSYHNSCAPKENIDFWNKRHDIAIFMNFVEGISYATKRRERNKDLRLFTWLTSQYSAWFGDELKFDVVASELHSMHIFDLKHRLRHIANAKCVDRTGSHLMRVACLIHHLTYVYGFVYVEHILMMSRDVLSQFLVSVREYNLSIGRKHNDPLAAMERIENDDLDVCAFSRIVDVYDLPHTVTNGDVLPQIDEVIDECVSHLAHAL